MKLSACLVSRQLQDCYGVEPSGKMPNELTLGRPIFLIQQESWPRGRVCLCDSTAFPVSEEPIPQETLVLVRGRIARTERHSSNNVLELPEDCDLQEVLNRLQSLYDRYENWDCRLRELVQNEEGIQALLDASFSVFHNPLILRAADFYMISYSSIIDEDPRLFHLIDPTQSFETLATSKLDPAYNEAQHYTEPFYLPEYLSGSRELCVNLFQHKNYSHRLILSENLTEIDDALAPLLNHLAGYIQMVLSHTDQENTGETYPLEDLLCDIISGKQTDYAAIDTNLAEYGWLPSHSYCCLNLKMASLDQQNLTSKYLCHHFEEIVSGSCAFRYENELVIFVNLARYGNTIDEMLNNTVIFLRDSFLKTGISNRVNGTMDLKYCYQQAKIALNIGGKYQSFRWVHKFEDISLHYLMDCCTRDLPMHMVCSRKLLDLKAYDQKHHSEYYETLRVYLETHLNAVQASRKLYIHRSTFLYRLDRIHELVNLDFDNEELLLYLMISYQILGKR